MRNLFRGLTVVSVCVAGGESLHAQSEKDVRVDFIAPDRCLIRINGDGRYLMLPIEECHDDARIEVIVNGRREQIVNARLAINRVDYVVPLEVSRYDREALVLAVETRQSRSDGRSIEDDACWELLALADDFDETNTEKYRLAFHHTPPRGWMNDPNGLVYKDGIWHLYYQYNPYGSQWQNMSWGHSSSTDLVNWKHHGVALEPNALGTVFSGNCAVDTDGSAGFGRDAIVGLYTSAGATQQQSLVWSTDGGDTFSFYPGNPVITLPTEARDPNIFRYGPGGDWVLILAHPLERETLIFTSPDLREWTLRSSFGRGPGAPEGIWECPDLFRLPVDGSDEEKWVVLCNLNPGGPFGGSATQYFVGDFDGRTFTPDRDEDGNVPTKWMDFGKDNYATVSFSDAPDGRRTVIGWMSNWEYASAVPTMQFRGANTLPRDLSLFRAPDGQLYLRSKPSPELTALRGAPTVSHKTATAGRKGLNVPLPTANDGICEIDLTIDPADNEPVTLTLANGAGEKTVMTYDPREATFSLDRTGSGLTGFHRDFPATTVAPTFSDGGRLTLRIFIDRASIEVFGDGGRFVMTNLVFPTEPYDHLTITSPRPARINALTVYPLHPAN
ncbi:MAG: GH32 C-terminal domain-containing protein [Muribaculaceae bacterium]|nr:GH32 C-terminal domain-containing protein [Muribaculaceae bacterium]